jgi:hypothetical protein
MVLESEDEQILFGKKNEVITGRTKKREHRADNKHM